MTHYEFDSPIEQLIQDSGNIDTQSNFAKKYEQYGIRLVHMDIHDLLATVVEHSDVLAQEGHSFISISPGGNGRSTNMNQVLQYQGLTEIYEPEGAVVSDNIPVYDLMADFEEDASYEIGKPKLRSNIIKNEVECYGVGFNQLIMFDNGGTPDESDTIQMVDRFLINTRFSVNSLHKYNFIRVVSNQQDTEQLIREVKHHLKDGCDRRELAAWLRSIKG